MYSVPKLAVSPSSAHPNVKLSADTNKLKGSNSKAFKPKNTKSKCSATLGGAPPGSVKDRH